MPLSVIIIVRNEEDKLPGALASVRELADEIVLVDTGSTDSTLKIARAEKKLRLLEIPFEDFSQAKQRALDEARQEWVLALDADERVSDELARKIRQLAVNQQLVGMGGFRVRRRNFILGRQMTSMGLERDTQLRLFRREGARYNGHLVHEGVTLSPGAPIGLLEEPIDHYTFGGIDSYLRKMDLYTSLEIREGGRRFGTWHLISSPPSTFCRVYFFGGGWRDGFAGFLWASLTVLGRFLRDVKLWIRQLKGD
jgi:(heptosyl)LPS beta-1,4-glucosyltransferase